MNQNRLPEGAKIANPQAENGHIDIANEIAEALMKVNLSPNQWRVLWAIWRKTYGWHKKEDRIAQSQICEMTGLDKRAVSRVVKQLVNRCILRRNGKLMGFQKDYDQWESLQHSRQKVYSTVDKRSYGQTGPDTKSTAEVTSEKSTTLAPKVYTAVDKKSTALSPTKETKETRQKKRKDPSLFIEDMKVLFTRLKIRRGWDSPRAAAEAKAGKWMLKQGYTVEQILQCFDALKGDKFWEDKPLYLMSVQSQVGEYFTKRQTQSRKGWKLPTGKEIEEGEARFMERKL